jgi:hypothetical protein
MDAYSSAARKFSLGDKGDRAVDELLNYIPDVAIKAAKNTKKYSWDAMLNLYQLEDHVFRLGLYKKLRRDMIEKGLSPDDAGLMAAKQAREGFVDYEKTSPLLEGLREGPYPFIAYMYGIVPRLAETMAKKPWKIAKWGLIWHGINAMGEDMSDDPEKIRKQRALMPEEQKRPLMGIPGMPSGMIKMPEAISPGTEDDWYLNIGRALPGGTDVFGQSESAPGNIPGIPKFLQPSFGAGGAILNTLQGIDPFRGRDIPEGERLDYLRRQFTPNLPIPGLGTYAGEKIERAIGEDESRTRDIHTIPSAVLSGLGLKTTPVSTRKLRKRKGYSFDKKIKNLRSKRRRLDRDDVEGRNKINEQIRQIFKDKRRAMNP